MSRLVSSLLVFIACISAICSVDLKQENKSLADILKLVNQNPGIEIRVDFEEETDPNGKSAIKASAEDNALLLAKELNKTSTNILDKLNKTANKLEAILKRLANLEHHLVEQSKTKVQKNTDILQHQIKTSNQTDSFEENDHISDLLLS